MKVWDVIIVGGGMAGLSTAYHLARLGAATLLLQTGDLGTGASAACSGRAQVNEGELDPLNLRTVTEGMQRLDSLEEELDTPFGWHRSGYLCLINSEHLWETWQHRSEVLTAAGIPTEMIDIDSLRKMEPYLNHQGFLGAAYSLEGQLDPFRFCWAYAKGARKHGGDLRPHSPVSGFGTQGNKIAWVESQGERHYADTVVIMAGAWTAGLVALTGVNLPIHFTHAEAMVTTPAPVKFHHTIGLANFYETIHGKKQAVSVGFHVEANGSLVITEAVEMTEEHHKRNSAWGLTGIADELIKLYPVLKKIRVLRSWASPVPYTPDDNPLIGWVKGFENLFISAGYKQTISALPVLSEWTARHILRESGLESLTLFSPNRFIKESESHDEKEN